MLPVGLLAPSASQIESGADREADRIGLADDAENETAALS
jgi:hypothetical protein